MDFQKIFNNFKNILEKKFPGYIEQAVLFGSHARGDANQHSDYDILIILKYEHKWRIEEAISLFFYHEIDLKFDIVTDIRIISSCELGRQPFYINVIKEGIVL